MIVLLVEVKDRRAASMPSSTWCLCKGCQGLNVRATRKRSRAALIAGFLIRHYLICDRWRRTLTSDRVTRSNSDTTLLELDRAIDCDSFWIYSYILSTLSSAHTHFSSSANSSQSASPTSTLPTMATPPSISVKDLSYKFQDGSEGLEHVTLDLPAGSRTLLIGGMSWSPLPSLSESPTNLPPTPPPSIPPHSPQNPTANPPHFLSSQRRRQNHPPPPPLGQTPRPNKHNNSRRRRPLQRHPRRRNLPRRRMGPKQHCPHRHRCPHPPRLRRRQRLARPARRTSLNPRHRPGLAHARRFRR